jgi:hypothetical protein
MIDPDWSLDWFELESRLIRIEVLFDQDLKQDWFGLKS